MAAEANTSPRTGTSAQAAAGLVAIQFLSFISMWLVSRSLGPDAYGRLGLALVAGVYAYQVVQAGLDAFQTRLLAQATAEEARRILGGTFHQKLYAALLALLAGAVLSLPYASTHDSLFILLGVFDGVVLGFTMPSAFDARGKTATYFGFAVIRQMLYLLGALLLTTVLMEWLSTWSVLALHVGAIVPQILLERRWIQRHYGAIDFSAARARSAEQLRAALPLSVGSAAWQISMVLGPPILAFSGYSHQMGLLVLSNQLATALHSLSLLFARLAMVRLASMPDPFSAEFGTAWARLMLLHTLAGALLALSASLGGHYLIQKVWGVAFSAAATLFVVDVWRVVGGFGGGVTSAALVCQSRLKTLAACHVAGLVCAAAASLILIPVYGAGGAVWGTVLGRAGFLVFSTLCLIPPVAWRGKPS